MDSRESNKWAKDFLFSLCFDEQENGVFIRHDRGQTDVATVDNLPRVLRSVPIKKNSVRFKERLSMRERIEACPRIDEVEY